GPLLEPRAHEPRQAEARRKQALPPGPPASRAHHQVGRIGGSSHLCVQCIRRRLFPMPTIRRAALALFTLLWIAAMTAHALPDHAPTTRAASNTAGPTAPTGDFANGTVLPNGRLVTPIGTRYDLGDFPLGLAIAPAGTLAVAINSGLGYGLNPGKQSSCTSDPASAGSPGQAAPDQSLSVIDLRTGRSRVITTVPTGRNPARRGMPGTYNYFYT